jgi:hypothetical protein
MPYVTEDNLTDVALERWHTEFRSLDRPKGEVLRANAQEG